MAKVFGIHAGNIEPSSQSFLSAGSGTYYPTFAFSCSAFSVTPTAGATYTNNSATFTVTQVVGNYLYATSSGTPTVFGSLVKSGGTGDGTVTFSTYTQPKKLRIRIVGAGGGGSGSGSASAGSGQAGGSSIIGGLTCGGGGGGVYTGSGGSGGAVSGSLSGAIVLASFSGAAGGNFTAMGSLSSTDLVGGGGGVSPFGGAGPTGNQVVGVGIGAVGNTGSGGGGAGLPQATAGYNGSGGGAGAYAELLLNNPGSSISYTVGALGAGGTPAGTSGYTGGAGGSGGIYIEESFTS